jgi:hypothetical protein
MLNNILILRRRRKKEEIHFLTFWKLGRLGFDYNAPAAEVGFVNLDLQAGLFIYLVSSNVRSSG